MVQKPMTIGQLARRTGMSIKTLREYEQLGMLYTRGRSESNYRLFGEETLWCIEVIRTMRSLGLTIKEIQELTAHCRPHTGGSFGSHLGRKLNDALARIDTRIAELQAVRMRIHELQSAHAGALAGRTELLKDPWSLPIHAARVPRLPLDSPCGVRV